MTANELEALPLPFENLFSDLEMRILEDIVRRIKINGFATPSADWQITRLQQLGESEENILAWIQEALDASEEQMETIFSEETLKEQYGEYEEAYKKAGKGGMHVKEMGEQKRLMETIKKQTSGEFTNISRSLGIAVKRASGRLDYITVTEYYQSRLDNAIMDIISGAFSYQTVLQRTINQLTESGIRQIDYKSGQHSRVDVAARRAIMTGFRQVQGKVNEQVAKDLDTDVYEVTYHTGARPDHQKWQGKVYSMEKLKSVCGLGRVDGLQGANCYHDYRPFIPGVSVRTYTNEQLERMMREENTPKMYNGRAYTAYQALQKQRELERTMRKYRQDIVLLEAGDSEEEAVVLKQARYRGTMQTYEDFSKKMNLPVQRDRILQDGLGTISTRKAAAIEKKANKIYNEGSSIRNIRAYYRDKRQEG